MVASTTVFGVELLPVLGMQPLPAAEPGGLWADKAADGCSAEKMVQHIQTNVPSSSTHGDEAAIDVGPQRQARAAIKGLELPPHIETAPVVLKQPGSVSPRYGCFGHVQH